jgi:hypothetical protein
VGLGGLLLVSSDETVEDTGTDWIKEQEQVDTPLFNAGMRYGYGVYTASYTNGGRV